MHPAESTVSEDDVTASMRAPSAPRRPRPLPPELCAHDDDDAFGDPRTDTALRSLFTTELDARPLFTHDGTSSETELGSMSVLESVPGALIASGGASAPPEPSTPPAPRSG